MDTPPDDTQDVTHPLETGTAVIQEYVKTASGGPGVYRMLNKKGDVLYVGKAKNIKKRVTSYTQPARLGLRIRRMVSETRSMEFVTTHTEAEALLLESNLIKKLRPRYNILLRDDKSFPQILVTKDHDFPQVLKHRGARRRKGDYFGPFASAWAVNETLNALQRAFLLRTCSDSVFNARTRPCLLYQIKRCAAPCVDRISQQDYTALVTQAHRFLKGENKALQDELAVSMQEASEALDFEKAAQFRDRIRAMARIQARQDINIQGVEEADVVAAWQDGGHTCIQVFFFRAGANFGNRAYFPSHAAGDPTEEVLEAFLGQFYADKHPPKLILTSHELPGHDVLKQALEVKAERRVELASPQRGDKRKMMDHALVNAREALGRRMSESASQRKLLNGLADALDLETPPERIEIYDNSHIQGAHAVGAMVVSGPEGFVKAAYRKFNIKLAPGNDDYAMMREVLTRRFTRALKEDPDKEGESWPDLVVIDGGAGQLSVACEVFADLGVDGVTIASIAKGADRNAGYDRVFLPERDPFRLEHTDPVNYFLQRLRDEAHRFAIGTHRAKRSRTQQKSILDNISGVGPTRKKALLHHFGSARAVAEAGLADLESVEGVNKATARTIYDHFHES